jgi:hypothetical protein
MVVWCQGGDAWDDRVALMFELYRCMPSYGHLMYAKHHYLSWDRPVRDLFWDEYRRLLGDEDDRLADPVAYSLWCDFFEDSAAVEETWHAVSRTGDLNERALQRMLAVAGPVPYRLKAPLYGLLVTNERWHLPLFRSLLASAFDVYGSVEEQAARLLLARLALPDTTPGLAELRQKLRAR